MKGSKNNCGVAKVAIAWLKSAWIGDFRWMCWVNCKGSSVSLASSSLTCQFAGCSFSRNETAGFFFFFCVTATSKLHDLCFRVETLNSEIHTRVLAFQTCIFWDRKKDPMAPNSVVCTPQFQNDKAKLKTSNDKQSMAKNALQMKTSLQTGYGKKKFLLNIGWSIITLHISLLIFSIYMKTITNTQNVWTSCETMWQDCF